MAVAQAEAIRTKALSYYGDSETPSNILSGPLLEVCNEAGFFQGAAWCLFYALGVVRSVLRAQGVVPPAHLAPQGSTGAFLRAAEAAGKVSREISSGAVVIYVDSAGVPFHAGLCLGPHSDPGFAVCIEGNTNNNGGPEGTSVLIHKRPVSLCRFIYW